MQLLEFLGRLPKSVVAGIAVAWLVALGAIDYLAPNDVSFVAFYFIPIFLVVWFVGRIPGLLMALLCALAWPYHDELPNRGHYSYPFVPYWNIGTKGAVFLAACYLFSIIKSAYDKEKSGARQDDLTGLANRRAFYEDAGLELALARRYGHPLSIAYVDVDNFKEINDRWGHIEGDKVLRFIATVMENCTREVDLVARLGGDEFAILIPETGPVGARAMAGKLHRALSERAVDASCPVTFSLGLVTFFQLPVSVDAMLKYADEVMYGVKQKGKNTIEQRVFEAGRIPE